ncbi:hypothetical protein GGR54DRAFT_610559 [Hypoxylon sp. NC1633]|nr:hypothetical protein GGR54DRAFT_610559 [Hypoxylon sp. NC1633]
MSSGKRAPSTPLYPKSCSHTGKTGECKRTPLPRKQLCWQHSRKARKELESRTQTQEAKHTSIPGSETLLTPNNARRINREKENHQGKSGYQRQVSCMVPRCTNLQAENQVVCDEHSRIAADHVKLCRSRRQELSSANEVAKQPVIPVIVPDIIDLTVSGDDESTANEPEKPSSSQMSQDTVEGADALLSLRGPVQLPSFQEFLEMCKTAEVSDRLPKVPNL